MDALCTMVAFGVGCLTVLVTLAVVGLAEVRAERKRQQMIDPWGE